MIVVTDVMSCVKLWLMPCCSVSTSFVMRESTSPYGRLSKYPSGRRLIFPEMSFLRL